MILRPIAPAASHSSPVHPAWPVIEHTEKNCGRPCWVITQPDHAALSGAIAAALAPTVVESLSQEIIRGIALHDEGWASFDGPMPHCDDELISFFDVNADTAVSAWLGSIQRAVIEGPMAGAIVSRHFWRIASMRLEQG
ncbi:MAG: DUF3891 family protein, partial [Acidobacteria bacterium]|nr:DUF3891 family protein [Acidobacteriota bacterium]